MLDADENRPPAQDTHVGDIGDDPEALTWCARGIRTPPTPKGQWHLKPSRLPFRHSRKRVQTTAWVVADHRKVRHHRDLITSLLGSVSDC